MTDLIDVKAIKRKSTIRFIIHLIVISLLTLIVISGSVISLIYSSLEYQLNLIINIIVDSGFTCLLIFYFFNIFPIVNCYYRLFKKINHVAYEHRRNLEFIEERNNKTIDNVKFRTLNFSYKEGENTYQENLYVLDNGYEFKKGEHYSLFTYHNIIIKLEEKSHASI